MSGERVQGADLFEPLVTAIKQSTRPRLLFISHAWGGGVEQHLQQLIDTVCATHDVIVLRGFLDGGVEIQAYAGRISEAYRVGGFSERTLPAWLDALRALHCARVHVHHFQGWPPAVFELIRGLDLPIDVTLHDYAYICPQLHLADEHGAYCGEPNAQGCAACLAKRPHPWGLPIEAWRGKLLGFLQSADRVISPHSDVTARYHRYAHSLKIFTWPHPERRATSPTVVKIALLGALSPIKGLVKVREVAELAKSVAPELSFRLIGHASEPLPPTVTATGSYQPADLPRLIAIERPDIFWFPSQIPETYSFTLSTALEFDLPIAATDIGAISARLNALHATKQVTLLPLHATATEWINAFRALRKAHPITTTTPSGLSYPGYLMHAPARLTQADASALDALLRAAPSPPTAPLRPLLDVFLIGRDGGHAESLRHIEHTFSTLPTGETEVIGRSRVVQLEHDERAMRAELALRTHELEAAESLSQQRDAAILIHERNIEALQENGTRAAAHIAHLESELQRITTSASWRYTRPIRGFLRAARAVPAGLRVLKRALFHERNATERLMRIARRGGARALLDRTRLEFERASAVSANGPTISRLSTPTSVMPLALRTDTAAPTLSIIVPVYGQHLTTYACLQSIAKFPPRCAYEVIVMDDAAPEVASEVLKEVAGVRFIRNAANLGFIGNVNTGAREARGQYLLILNNDTAVTYGAINALLDTFSSHEHVGLVGAKLLNRDGTLQEAGGIIWRDGSGWNWGRNANPDKPEYNYVRDVDYCSGAALLITRALFEDLGGFDSHYAPAYYEDTDLAFRIRERGLRTVYQPHAAIFHLEGVSHGRDETKGVKAFQTVNAKKFYERWKKTLERHAENGTNPAREINRNARSRILIVEACMLTPDQDSGSIRMLNLLRILKEARCHVTFLADNLEGTAEYRMQLEALGVEVLHGAWAGSTRRVLRERGKLYDAIIFCRHYIASAYIDSVRLYAPMARIFFDTVDLHYLREQREADLRNDAAMREIAEATREKELAVVRKADVTIVVSDVEARELSIRVPHAKVAIVSNIHAPAPKPAPFEGRSGLLFVGGFRHPPNVDAVIWFAREVLPKVSLRIPGIVLHVVGSNVPSEIAALNSEQIKVHGFVKDIEPLLNGCRVSIAPLRYGAGVKGKVNEAMNYGLPVVATSCAVESMHVSNGVDVLIADEASAFADAIARAYNDASLWRTLSNGGQENVKRHFSLDAAREAVRSAILGKI